MAKFGRNYFLAVETQNGEFVEIDFRDTAENRLPLTVEFTIQRNLFSSANSANIRIYNLAKTKRDQILKNVMDYRGNKDDNIRKVLLQAGYGQNLPTILNGFVDQCWSVREGNNMITEISGYDAGFAFNQAQFSSQFPKGTDQSVIIDTMIKSMKPFGVDRGAVGKFNRNITRGNSYNGSTPELLAELTGGCFFIDNGKAHCLRDNEAIIGPVAIVNSSSGLIGTPVREQTYVNFDMIFEPQLLMGQVVQLESDTVDGFNAQYKIISLRHRAMISESVAGDAITSVGCIGGRYDIIKQEAQ